MRTTDPVPGPDDRCFSVRPRRNPDGSVSHVAVPVGRGRATRPPTPGEAGQPPRPDAAPKPGPKRPGPGHDA